MYEAPPEMDTIHFRRGLHHIEMLDGGYLFTAKGFR